MAGYGVKRTDRRLRRGVLEIPASNSAHYWSALDAVQKALAAAGDTSRALSMLYDAAWIAADAATEAFEDMVENRTNYGGGRMKFAQNGDAWATVLASRQGVKASIWAKNRALGWDSKTLDPWRVTTGAARAPVFMSVYKGERRELENGFIDNDYHAVYRDPRLPRKKARGRAQNLRYWGSPTASGFLLAFNKDIKTVLFNTFNETLNEIIEGEE